ncbi:MAG: hypothetical protein RLZ62_70, partial [Bacteroidota bacterium]
VLIPVLERIHSSDVSRKDSNHEFGTAFCGTAIPIAVRRAFAISSKMLASYSGDAGAQLKKHW